MSVVCEGWFDNDKKIRSASIRYWIVYIYCLYFARCSPLCESGPAFTFTVVAATVVVVVAFVVIVIVIFVSHIHAFLCYLCSTPCCSNHTLLNDYGVEYFGPELCTLLSLLYNLYTAFVRCKEFDVGCAYVRIKTYEAP